MSKIIVSFLFLIFSTQILAGSTWIKIANLHFPTPGYYDLVDIPPNTFREVVSNKIALYKPTDCSINRFDRIKFIKQSGSSIKANLKGNSSDQGGIWYFYEAAEFSPIKTVEVSIGIQTYDCLLSFYQDSSAIQIPSPPLRKHCDKVAFDLKYYYETEVEQAVTLQPDVAKPCFVYVRFYNLEKYGYFLFLRENEHKSPDYEILQQENVRVDLEHQIMKIFPF